MTNTPQFPGEQPPVFPGGPGQQAYSGVPGQPPTEAAGPAPASAPARRKKPWFKRWWVWVLALIVVAVVGGSLGKGGSGSPSAANQQTAGAASAEQAKAKLTLDDGWKMDKSNGFAVYVNGYVSNNTDKAITNYVQITFDALDSSGANLGTCLANTNTIDANGKWKFQAVCTSQADQIDKVRFKDISGF